MRGWLKVQAYLRKHVYTWFLKYAWTVSHPLITFAAMASLVIDLDSNDRQCFVAMFYSDLTLVDIQCRHHKKKIVSIVQFENGLLRVACVIECRRACAYACIFLC